MWLYFYGLMAYQVATTLSEYLPDSALALGQLMALLSLLGLLAGWHLSPPRPVKPPTWTYQPTDLWNSGAILLLIAIVGQYSFFGQSDLDFQNTSNYWYLMFYVGYPGMALCIIARPQFSKLKRLSLSWILGFLILTLMWHHIINARRGPLLPLIIIITYLPYLTSGRTPSRSVIFGSLVSAGLLMTAFLSVRQYIYSPEASDSWTTADMVKGWIQGISSLDIQQSVFGKAQKFGDNEYLFHCGSIATIWELRDYQYGTGYLTLLVHWIPRQIWATKPALQQGLFESTWENEIAGLLGWSLTRGYSPGGVANTFEQVGLLCPLVWFAFARFVRYVFELSEARHNHLASTQYVGLICVSHWLVAQGIGAMFVPACYFLLVPYAVFKLVSARSVHNGKILHKSSSLPHLRSANSSA